MPPAESALIFRTFEAAHWVVIGATVLLAVGLPLWARRSRRVLQISRWALVLLLPANELGIFFYAWATEGAARAVTGFLPIHICPAAAFLIAWTLWRRTQWTYEFAYYWGLSATLQGLLTPNIEGQAVGSYWLVQFFISHCGVIVAVILATVALPMRPRRGSMLRVFLWTGLYAGCIGVVDWLLGPKANYMFLRAAPAGQTPFYFWPWPWYILPLAGVAFALFWLLYVPFQVLDRRRRVRGSESAEVAEKPL